MTSCGCFEAICAYLPECNGIMIVNREFLGETPVGMTFSTLAGSVGGGQQTPGFYGVGKVFLTSKKFMFAEGGHGRIAWMPKELKESLREDLEKRFGEKGLDGFFDKIADETVATTADEVRAYMEKVDHPALKMPDMDEYAEDTSATAAPAPAAEKPAKKAPAAKPAPAAAPKATPISVDGNLDISGIAEAIRKDVVSGIIDALSEKFLGQASASKPPVAEAAPASEAPKPGVRRLSRRK
jgi:CO dehydrogenase/acetyl-CoA synthase beta subunit